MKYKVSALLFFHIIVLSFLIQNLYAQFYWNASAESGYFNSSGDQLQNKNDVLNKLECQSGYKHQTKKNLAKLNVKIKPEFYGFSNGLVTFKFAADGLYAHQGEYFDWTFNIATQKYNFSDNNFDISFETFLMNTEASWYVQPEISVQTKAGFAYRNMDVRGSTTLDILFFEGTAVHFFNSYFRVGAGFYVEKFSIDNRYELFFHSNQNNTGWRAGPQINLYYIKNFVLNIEYKFFVHDSKVTVYPSYDQWLRLMTGKTILTKLSAFILFDFYFRDFTYKDIQNNLDLMYTPINSENRFYFKSAYDIKKNVEIYLKTGYFDEKLFYNDYSFSGWNGLIGIEIHN